MLGTKKLLALAVSVVFVFGAGTSFAAGTINNPYARVNWEQDKAYLANLHTHTNLSDGNYTQQEMFVEYQKYKYDFLVFADHDYVHGVWPNFKVTDGPTDPNDGIKGNSGLPAIDGWKVSDILTFKGNELSKTGWQNHHTLSYFSDFVSDGTAKSVLELLQQCADFDKEGVQVLAHPGRYVYQDDGKQYWDTTNPNFKYANPYYYNIDPSTALTWDIKMNWYVKLYTSIPTLIGMEVLNYGNLYPRDREIWDSVLIKTMPARPIWGFANDDTHFITELKEGGLNTGYNVEANRDMNYMVLKSKTVADFKAAMQNGNFYFASRYTTPEHPHWENKNEHYSPGTDKTIPLPKITKIAVDEHAGTITIQAEHVATITWISCGQVVRTTTTTTGDILNYVTTTYAQDTTDGDGVVVLKNKGTPLDKYVRAVLTGPGGESFTQPFGIVK